MTMRTGAKNLQHARSPGVAESGCRRLGGRVSATARLGRASVCLRLRIGRDSKQHGAAPIPVVQARQEHCDCNSVRWRLRAVRSHAGVPKRALRKRRRLLGHFKHMHRLLGGAAPYPGEDAASFAWRRARPAAVECRVAGLWSDRAARIVVHWGSHIRRDMRPAGYWPAALVSWHDGQRCARRRLASGSATSRAGPQMA